MLELSNHLMFRRWATVLAVAAAAAVTALAPGVAQAAKSGTPSITLNSVTLTPGAAGTCDATVSYTLSGLPGNPNLWTASGAYQDPNSGLIFPQFGPLAVSKKDDGTQTIVVTGAVSNDGSTTNWATRLDSAKSNQEVGSNVVIVTDSC